MNEAKIRLSPKEAALVMNADMLLTKNEIIGKVKLMLATLSEKQQQYISTCDIQWPQKAMKSTPKISRGENYKGLPYLVLDYPRCFDKENIMAIRTMFWWGHFFSITLHLAGKYKKMNELKCIHAYDILKENGFYYCSGSNQWEHHFEENYYTSIKEIPEKEFKKSLLNNSFIKLAAKIQLPDWDNAIEGLLQHFQLLVKITSD